MAKLSARFEIQKHIPALTLDEFLIRKQQGTDFSMKPVGVSPVVDPAPGRPPSVNGTDTAPANSAPEARGTGLEMDLAIEPTTKPATPLATPEPIMIEFASEPPHEDPGGIAAEEGIV